MQSLTCVVIRDSPPSSVQLQKPPLTQWARQRHCADVSVISYHGIGRNELRIYIVGRCSIDNNFKQGPHMLTRFIKINFLRDLLRAWRPPRMQGQNGLNFN